MSKKLFTYFLFGDCLEGMAPVRWRKARELAMMKRTGAANTPLEHLDLGDAVKHWPRIRI